MLPEQALHSIKQVMETGKRYPARFQIKSLHSVIGIIIIGIIWLTPVFGIKLRSLTKQTIVKGLRDNDVNVFQTLVPDDHNNLDYKLSGMFYYELSGPRYCFVVYY